MRKRIDINSDEYRNTIKKLLGEKVVFIKKQDKIQYKPEDKIQYKPQNKIPTTQCIAVKELRKKYKDNNIDLRKWMQMEENVYTGRNGRIFINKEIFHYPGSKWANPFKVSEYSLEDSLRLYEEHVRNDPNLINSLKELQGKTLGCFCDQSQPCHAKILVKLYKEFFQNR